MELVHQERRVRREMSPDRAKMCAQTQTQTQTRAAMKAAFKKVQVVYYLSTNGHLHHPHYIEVTHLAKQHLRLKDVMDRLTVLRGKGMPSLYSWSCKRSYKNGYVWNDLAQNDVIFPSEGGEYVLKGSELLLDCTEKLHHLQLGNNVQQFQHGNIHESNFYTKRRISASKQPIDDHDTMNDRHVEDENADEFDEKSPHTTCSRGVSTDELEQELKHKHKHSSIKNASHTELNLDTNSLSSPPSTTSSTPSDNPNSNLVSASNVDHSDSTSKRFEDGDPIGNEPMLNRNSMLFSLIACGGSGSFRKTVLPPSVAPCTAGRKSCSGSSLHKGVVCKAAVAAEEDRVMINYMSENPRFGNMQAEEKEYFSGSIVESITNDHQRTSANEPSLKKSSSYNQERCAKAGLGEEAEEEVKKKEKGLMKGKCIPRKKKASSKHPKK